MYTYINNVIYLYLYIYIYIYIIVPGITARRIIAESLQSLKRMPLASYCCATADAQARATLAELRMRKPAQVQGARCGDAEV